MKSKIFVALSTFAEHGQRPLSLLQESGYAFVLNPLKKRLSQDELIQMGRDCDGVIAGLEPYDDYVLDHTPRLRCISRCGVGVDNIAVEKAKAKGIRIYNTPDVVTQPVAELTVAMIFDLLRRLTFHTQLLRSGKWERVTGNLLKGKNVGILGLGRIGKKVAEMVKKLDANVFGVDLYPDTAWAKQWGVKVIALEEALKVSDILSIHLSVLEDQAFQLGEKEFFMMKKGAFLINVARGQFINEEALYHALYQKHLAGAALDVFSKEPYTGKLCELNNVILTPHVGTLTEESRLQMELEATQNIVEFFKAH